MNEERTTHVDPILGVHEAYGVVRIAFRDNYESPEHELMLSPEASLDLLKRLAPAVANAAVDVLHAYERGRCTKCGNVRLVQEERHGSPWNVNCPQCTDKPRTGWNRVMPWVREWTAHFFDKRGNPL